MLEGIEYACIWNGTKRTPQKLLQDQMKIPISHLTSNIVQKCILLIAEATPDNQEELGPASFLGYLLTKYTNVRHFELNSVDIRGFVNWTGATLSCFCGLSDLLSNQEEAFTFDGYRKNPYFQKDTLPLHVSPKLKITKDFGNDSFDGSSGKRTVIERKKHITMTHYWRKLFPRIIQSKSERILRRMAQKKQSNQVQMNQTTRTKKMINHPSCCCSKDRLGVIPSCFDRSPRSVIFKSTE